MIPGADALGKAFDWGQDLVSNAVGQVGDVIDTASNAIDTATAVGGAVRDTVVSGIERGIDVASDAVSTVVSPNGIDRKLNELTAPVDTLKPGESVSFEAGVEVNAAVSASGGGAIDVKRNDDGTYTVSGSVDGTLGGKISDTGLDFGGTVRVEFKADDAAQARQIVAALAKGGGLDPKLAQAGGLTLDKPVIGLLRPSCSC